MTNKKIAKILENLAATYSILDSKKYYYQILSYQKSADIINNLTEQVKDLIENKQFLKIQGIGENIKKHIVELIEKGKSEYFEEVLKQVPQSVFPLLEISGVGPQKAYKLVKALNLKNCDNVILELEKKAKRGEIAKIFGFGKASQSEILISIEDFKLREKTKDRILLPLALEIASTIVNYLKKSEKVLKIEIAGSIRRKASTVGDIDIAIATENSESVFNYFLKLPQIKRILGRGEKKLSVILNSDIRVDLMTVKPLSFASLLQHFTGSKNHNIHLRKIAISEKKSISENGLKVFINNSWRIKNLESEEKLYQELGMEYIFPELREDSGEIELARNNCLPSLIKLSDIKGDFHIHTNYPLQPSHDLGENSMTEMLIKAQGLGYEYLAFSDHNPSVGNHTKDEIYQILKRRKGVIEQLKMSKKYIRIINMLEIDILPNGDLAIDEKALEYLDAAIVSVHSVFKMSKEQMTKRILKGLSNPKAKILAHPTGAMFGKRLGYQVDWEMLFRFAKINNKALEINSWSERSDLPYDIIKKAVDFGINLTIDTDSHKLKDMDLLKFGIWQARRGWSKKENILNAKNYNEVKEFLEIKF